MAKLKPERAPTRTRSRIAKLTNEREDQPRAQAMKDRNLAQTVERIKKADKAKKNPPPPRFPNNPVKEKGYRSAVEWSENYARNFLREKGMYPFGKKKKTAAKKTKKPVATRRLLRRRLSRRSRLLRRTHPLRDLLE